MTAILPLPPPYPSRAATPHSSSACSFINTPHAVAAHIHVRPARTISLPPPLRAVVCSPPYVSPPPSPLPPLSPSPPPSTLPWTSSALLDSPPSFPNTLTRSRDELDDSDRESPAPAPSAPVTRGHADKRRRTGAAPASGASAASAAAAAPPSAHTGSPHSRPGSQAQYRSAPAPGHSLPGSTEFAHAQHPYSRSHAHPYGYEHGPPGYVPGYGSRERAHDRERERERERRGERPPSPAVEVHALSHPQPGRRGSQLSIKPIGFGASRESRKSGGQPGEHPVPSPVVMGFDFKGIDGDQMKTVRETISIREQQQALIAQRRRDVVASTPHTPKELTFKGWQPKEPAPGASSGQPTPQGGSMAAAQAQAQAQSRAVSQGQVPPGTAGGQAPDSGRRREKTRDRMSVGTGPADKDGPPSKSGPAGGLAAQQQAAREHGLPSAHLAPAPYANGAAAGSHMRGRTEADEYARHDTEVARRYMHPEARHDWGPRTGHDRSVTEGGPRRGPGPLIPSGGRYEDRRVPPHPAAHGHPSGRNGHPSGSYARAPGGAGSDTDSPPPHRVHLPPTGGGGPPPAHGHAPGPGGPYGGPGPSTAGLHEISRRREAFLAPYNQLYDHIQTTDSTRLNLEGLLHRYENIFGSQVSQMQDFKATANQANQLLSSLQASADSIKELVRYEVSKALRAERETHRVEVDELKKRIGVLEAEKKGEGESKEDEEVEMGSADGKEAKDVEMVADKE